MAAPRPDPDRLHTATLGHRSPTKPLTIESLHHLHQLVGHVLEEETGYRDTDKDAWVSGIESALNDLARAVVSGAWLSGIRRAKAMGREREEQAAAGARKREQERIAKEKETEARNKVKSRAPAHTELAKSAKETDTAVAEVKTEVTHPRKPPSDDANRNMRALQQLRNIANTRRLPTFDDEQHARHLLLTVAMPDVPPSSGIAGDATVQRCTFTPGIYSLPAPDLFGEDPDDNCEAVVNSTLYGFREWDGAHYSPL